MKGWRTLVVNAATIGIAWLNSTFDFVTLDDSQQAAAVVTMVAIVNMVLRKFTTTPVGESA